MHSDEKDRKKLEEKPQQEKAETCKICEKHYATIAIKDHYICEACKLYVISTF